MSGGKKTGVLNEEGFFFGTVHLRIKNFVLVVSKEEAFNRLLVDCACYTAKPSTLRCFIRGSSLF